MTKGKPTDKPTKKLFLNCLMKSEGHLRKAAEMANVSYHTMYNLIYANPDKDPQFSKAAKAIKRANNQLIADAAEESLLQNVRDNKEISTIFALKAYAGKSEAPQEHRHTIEDNRQPKIPLDALSPKTLKMIQKDMQENKGIDLDDLEEAETVDYEELEYDGHKLKDGLPIYDPDAEPTKRQSPSKKKKDRR